MQLATVWVKSVIKYTQKYLINNEFWVLALLLTYGIKNENMVTIKHGFKICSGCNFFCTENEAADFCPYCGDKLINKCPECEASIKTPHANYCTQCGSKYPGRALKWLRYKE